MPNKHHSKKKSHNASAEKVNDQKPETSAENVVDDNHAADENLHHTNSSEETTDEVKLDFPYSGLVRAYAPKAMELAEKAATDWKKDGSFMNLGIDNPYANMAVSMGLKKAKELEKKLDEKGVLSAVRMGVEVLKQQVNKKK